MKRANTSSGLIQTTHGPLQVMQVQVEENVASPTLVFLHDALGSIAQWRDFPLHLAEKCQLPAVVFDRPGHGGSGPLYHARNTEYLHRDALEVLPELLDKVAANEHILIGHSDGGTIALIYAAYHSPTAVITEAAHAFVEEQTLESIRLATARKAELIGKLSQYHHEKTEALFDAWSHTWLSPDFRHWSMEGLLPRINCPALIMQGTDDRYGTAEQVNRIVRGIGDDAEACWIKDGGHSPHHKTEPEVLDKMASFIEKIITPAEREKASRGHTGASPFPLGPAK